MKDLIVERPMGPFDGSFPFEEGCSGLYPIIINEDYSNNKMKRNDH